MTASLYWLWLILNKDDYSDYVLFFIVTLMDHWSHRVWASQSSRIGRRWHLQPRIPSYKQTHSNGREGVLKSYTVVNATRARASCPYCVETHKHLRVTKFQNPTRLFLGWLFILSNGTHLIEDLAFLATQLAPPCCQVFSPCLPAAYTAAFPVWACL